MSGRAAWRLESLGFADVHHYAAGKVDWLASGLPREGRLVGYPRVGDAVRRDVPTCRLIDRIGPVAERVREAGWDRCVVVSESNVVLGLLEPKALRGDPERLAEQVMESGPTTFRPSELLADMAMRLMQAEVASVLVTTPDGQLIGLLQRDDAERLTGVASRQHQHSASSPGGPVSP